VYTFSANYSLEEEYTNKTRTPYLYLKHVKMSFFSSFLFSSTKSKIGENRRVEQALQGVGGLIAVGGKRWWGKGVR
jgi:hypothetical protein